MSQAEIGKSHKSRGSLAIRATQEQEHQKGVAMEVFGIHVLAAMMFAGAFGGFL